MGSEMCIRDSVTTVDSIRSLPPELGMSIAPGSHEDGRIAATVYSSPRESGMPIVPSTREGGRNFATVG